MTGKIIGTGAFLPAYVMDNFEIEKMIDTNDAWIRERTGIARRHIAQTETAVSMAVAASKDAMAESGLAAEDIDLVIVATSTSNVLVPCAACEVQKELALVNATCFDLSAACSGFLISYNTALAYMEAGLAKNALLIGTEQLSRIVNWEDRGSCMLFGDGAGAVVLQATEGRRYQPVSHSDGSMGYVLTSNNKQVNQHDPEGDPAYLLAMDGQAVFKFAARKVPEIIFETLTLNQIEQTEIDYYILHQANKRIIEAIAKRLKVSVEKCPMNIEDTGNTSSASIPILLNDLNRKGALKRGDKLMMAGFGGGLTWSAAILEW